MAGQRRATVVRRLALTAMEAIRTRSEGRLAPLAGAVKDARNAPATLVADP
jgi:hypothetical protein